MFTCLDTCNLIATPLDLTSLEERATLAVRVQYLGEYHLVYIMSGTDTSLRYEPVTSTESRYGTIVREASFLTEIALSYRRPSGQSWLDVTTAPALKKRRLLRLLITFT